MLRSVAVLLLVRAKNKSKNISPFNMQTDHKDETWAQRPDILLSRVSKPLALISRLFSSGPQLAFPWCPPSQISLTTLTIFIHETKLFVVGIAILLSEIHLDFLHMLSVRGHYPYTLVISNCWELACHFFGNNPRVFLFEIIYSKLYDLFWKVKSY